MNFDPNLAGRAAARVANTLIGDALGLGPHWCCDTDALFHGPS